jgi:hypothetical protein
MIRRSTWIVLAVFVVLLGFLIYWQQWGPGASSDDAMADMPTVAPREPVFDLPEDVTVVAVRVESAEGGLVEVRRENGQEQWTLVEPPHEEGTDSQQVQTMVDQLVALQESSALEAAPSLDVTGLESPAYTITLTLEDGTEEKLYIGDETITGSTYYVRVEDGSPQVVNQYSVDAAIGMLDTLPLLPTPTAESES